MKLSNLNFNSFHNFINKKELSKANSKIGFNNQVHYQKKILFLKLKICLGLCKINNKNLLKLYHFVKVLIFSLLS